MEEENSAVIDKSPAIQENNQTRIIAKALMAAYSGPIPPATEFKEYEKTLPGAADRILKMAENENAHRHKEESCLRDAAFKLDNKEANERIMGLCFAFVIIMSCIFLGFFLLCVIFSVRSHMRRPP